MGKTFRSPAPLLIAGTTLSSKFFTASPDEWYGEWYHYLPRMVTVWCAPPFLLGAAFCKLGMKCWSPSSREERRKGTEAETLPSAAKAEFGPRISARVARTAALNFSIDAPLKANWAWSGQRNADPCVLIQGGKEQILKERTHSKVKQE